MAAATDRRIDAIAWHSLLTSLYREDIAKPGWGAALGGLGLPTATLLGVLSPAGVQTGTLDPAHPLRADLRRHHRQLLGPRRRRRAPTWWASRGWN